MNQMLQESHLQDAPEVNESSETIARPPVPAHPRFAKPQRVAFVQSSWHREVVEECRIAFLDEIEARHIARALMDVQLRTEVPVFSAVLTPQQFHESAAHFDFFRKHFATKGVEVAEACANTLLSLERLRGQVAAGIV